MKKKKLKKKIKKQKKRVDILFEQLGHTIEALNLSESNVMQCKNAITKLENDNKYYKEWMDRSGVDYKSWFKTDSRSCTDCKYYELINSNGPIPCYGCTSTDKKMFEPKGENNGN